MQHPEITPTPPVHLPPVHLPPVAKGNAPWERSGASHLPPTSQIAQQKAAKWVQQAEKQRETQEERRKRKEEQRHQRLQQQKQQRIQQLEQNARQMFIAGFFALPLLWLVALIYFRQEHKAQDASPLIKDYYRKALICFIIYSLVFLAWFITFQVKTDALKSLSILSFSGTSPSGI